VTARGVLLALVLALPVALASAGDAAVPLEFAGSARLDGALDALDAASSGWALLVFRDAPGDSFALALDGGSEVVHHTAVQADGPARTPPVGTATTRDQVADAVHGALGLAPGSWASLYVQADRVELSAGPVSALLGPAADGDNADGHLPRDAATATAVRPAGHQLVGDGAALALRGAADADAGSAAHVVLHATGVRVLEWHNATLACDAGAACPAAFAPPGGGTPPLPGARVLDYVEVLAAGGDLRGESHAVLAAAGGAALDLAVNGTIRLPQAALAGPASCAGRPCPDPAGRTLEAAGLLQLAGVGPAVAGTGRLHADLSGAFGARLDERAAPAFGRAAAVAAAVAVAAPLLVKAALALFARSARPPALRHPKRRALYELIRAEPGQSFRGLQRRLGWQNGTLSNHMARLLDARLVASRRYRNTVRYFESAACADAAWAAAVVLANPDLRRLHGWLQAHPTSTQGAVVAHGLAAWGWRRSTTQDRLRELEEGGVVEVQRHGRKALYSARSPDGTGPLPATVVRGAAPANA
jgi:predicted transcriptional regulator